MGVPRGGGDISPAYALALWASKGQLVPLAIPRETLVGVSKANHEVAAAGVRTLATR